MGFIGWLVIIALTYAAVAKALLMIIDGIRRRRWEGLFLLAMAVAFPAIMTCIMVSVYTFARVDLGRTYTYVERPLDATGVGLIVSVYALFVLGAAAIDYVIRGKLTWQEIKRRKELSRQIKLHLALVTGAIVFSVPFYWLITTSLRPDDRVFLWPPTLLPTEQERVKIGGEERPVYFLEDNGKEVRVAKMAELENDKWRVRLFPGKRDMLIASKRLRDATYITAKWSNYSEALAFLPAEYNRGLRPLWNTVYVTILVIVGTVFSSSLVAFSFARLRWPGRDMLFVILLATMMIPTAVTMLPVFLIFRALGWIDTLRPLWFPALFGSAFNVFLLRQFFMTIPNDLEDAAKIDGCGYFTIYWRIMLPLIKPALAAITIFAFMGSWNSFMGPLIYISSPENMPLSYALQLFQGAHGGEPAMMMAAATLVMLPVLVVFFITQRYMIQGVTLTGIKG